MLIRDTYEKDVFLVLFRLKDFVENGCTAALSVNEDDAAAVGIANSIRVDGRAVGRGEILDYLWLCWHR